MAMSNEEKKRLNDKALRSLMDDILKNAARTAMNAKDISPLKDFFADLALNAVKNIADEEGNTFSKVANVKIVKAPGKS